MNLLNKIRNLLENLAEQLEETNSKLENIEKQLEKNNSEYSTVEKSKYTGNYIKFIFIDDPKDIDIETNLTDQEMSEWIILASAHNVISESVLNHIKIKNKEQYHNVIKMAKDSFNKLMEAAQSGFDLNGELEDLNNDSPLMPVIVQPPENYNEEDYE